MDIRLVRKFAEPLSLDELRVIAALQNMELLRRGSRLSVQPVTAAEWKAVEKLAEKKAKAKGKG